MGGGWLVPSAGNDEETDNWRESLIWGTRQLGVRMTRKIRERRAKTKKEPGSEMRDGQNEASGMGVARKKRDSRKRGGEA